MVARLWIRCQDGGPWLRRGGGRWSGGEVGGGVTGGVCVRVAQQYWWMDRMNEWVCVRRLEWCRVSITQSPPDSDLKEVRAYTTTWTFQSGCTLTSSLNPIAMTAVVSVCKSWQFKTFNIMRLSHTKVDLDVTCPWRAHFDWNNIPRIIFIAFSFSNLILTSKLTQSHDIRLWGASPPSPPAVKGN